MSYKNWSHGQTKQALNSLVKSLSYLTRTMEDIFFGIGLKSHNMKLNALIKTHLKIAN